MKNNTVRIVAGQWRGHKLNFPASKNIRPTPDRLRETLFNWLMHDIRGAECLDAFAGSGALGFEALSRGAKHVTFLEQNGRICESLKQTLQAFDVDYESALLSCTNTLRWLKRPAKRAFDIIFLDPPFHKHLIEKCFAAINDYGWLKPGGVVYAEYECELLVQGLLPEGWQCLKQKASGEVGVALLQKPFAKQCVNAP